LRRAARHTGSLLGDISQPSTRFPGATATQPLSGLTHGATLCYVACLASLHPAGCFIRDFLAGNRTNGRCVKINHESFGLRYVASNRDSASSGSAPPVFVPLAHRLASPQSAEPRSSSSRTYTQFLHLRVVVHVHVPMYASLWPVTDLDYSHTPPARPFSACLC